jgi:lysozyme
MTLATASFLAAESPRGFLGVDMPRIVQFGLLALLSVAIVLGFSWTYFSTFSPDRGRYPIRGIDVSHHQGVIDWQAVADDDVGFAYIKASEGGDYVDKDFATNVRAARDAGIAVGAYHFFTMCRPGAEQAANFLAQVKAVGAMLPPAVDLEYEGNCASRPDAKSVAEELAAFLALVEAALGKQAVFYLTYGFYDDYAASLPERPLWTRWIAWHPADEDWLIWQYHDKGTVKGIAGDVDLNVWQGDRASLLAQVGS